MWVPVRAVSPLVFVRNGVSSPIGCMDSHAVPGGCVPCARVLRLETFWFLLLAASGLGRSGCRATVQCVTPWVARRHRYTAARLSPGDASGW